MVIESGTITDARLAMPIKAAAPQTMKNDESTGFGRYVSTELEEDDLESFSEPWYRYDTEDNSRIFYPVCVGEVLNERYLIEHKLGFGGFSTVWMVCDLWSKRNMAIKIMCLGDYGNTEICIQDKIVQNVSGISHLVIYLDSFTISGNGDSYKVLVYPLLGPSLSSISPSGLSMATRMSAAKQLLETLNKLHKAGFVHRGK